MSVPETRSTRVSLERGNSPMGYAQRLYTQFLQGLFNFNPSGCLHWEPDEERTEVIIRAEAPLDLRTAGKVPAITSVLGPVQYQGMVIDQLVLMNMASEHKLFSDLLSSHFVVYCLAEKDVVAQWMANVVISGTLANRRLLESPNGFHQIARPAPSMNAVSPPGALVQGDVRGLVMVQVNIPFTLQWTWETTPKASSADRSLEMITRERRASDFPYTAPTRLERVELAMTLEPIYVRRPGATASPIRVTEGTNGFQAVVTDTSTDEA